METRYVIVHLGLSFEPVTLIYLYGSGGAADDPSIAKGSARRL